MFCFSGLNPSQHFYDNSIGGATSYEPRDFARNLSKDLWMIKHFYREPRRGYR